MNIMPFGSSDGGRVRLLFVADPVLRADACHPFPQLIRAVGADAVRASPEHLNRLGRVVHPPREECAAPLVDLADVVCGYDVDVEQRREVAAIRVRIQVRQLPRVEIASASIDVNGKIIVADDLDQAVEIANALAPEHLELCVDNPFDYLHRVRHAGSIFMGRHCPEALGDYLAGPNHTLPTGGTARFYSPLSVDDFVKKSQYTYFSADALAAVADKIALFARKEGLEGHARSVLSRFDKP